MVARTGVKRRKRIGGDERKGKRKMKNCEEWPSRKEFNNIE